MACSQTVSNHPAKGAAPAGTLLAAKAVGARVRLAVSGVWVAAVEVAVVEVVVVEVVVVEAAAVEVASVVVVAEVVAVVR